MPLLKDGQLAGKAHRTSMLQCIAASAGWVCPVPTQPRLL